MNDDKLDAIHNAINELVSYKKTKIEAKNNYLKYHESKLKSLNEDKPKSVEEPKEEPKEPPKQESKEEPKVENLAPIEEPPEIILPSFSSIGNNRFNKRGF